MPVSNWNPTKPKLRGNGVIVTTQIEKTAQITASHINRILSRMLIFQSEDTFALLIEKSYELRIFTLNI